MAECAAPTDEVPSSSWARVKTKKKPTGGVLWEKRAIKAKREPKKKKQPSFSAVNMDQRDPQEDQDPVVYSVRSSTTVNAPLDTVLKTLDASVATAHRSFTRIIYGNLVADSSVLFHSSAQGTDYLDNRENDSFETLAVRWFVCHSSNPMTSDGDFCLQEYTKRHSIDELPMNGEHYNNNNNNNNGYQDNGGDRKNGTNTIEGLHSLQEMPVAYKLFRSLETRHCPELQESHRLLLQLSTVAAVRNSKFVAFTLFTSEPQGNRNQPSEVEGEAVHYLKVKGSAKLMKVADNLRCCEPVLRCQKSVITRNTWNVIGNSAMHPSGYEFRQLPVVLGPQQARFYAGVPLVDTKKRYCYGALAVFDAAISPGEDDDSAMTSVLQTLQKYAREAVAAVDERRKDLELRTFLQAPLIQLRQSEPTLHLSMDLSRRSQHWQDIGDQLSLDGDSDDDEIEEAQRRLEYELHHGHRRSSVDPNSAGKSRVDKPHKGYSTPKSSSVGKTRVEYFQNKMQELVQRAQDTQAQMVENTVTMERHGVPIV
ncbi:hypothetical protein BBP00_00008049 [Phytophthora kernoviae]|uniref:GAF domain-containing protein n=1 Tax=Phytophthora kernoviae TaxID=325452 RepID=A0A3F2RGM2_9STRA|nr:hypothetical protein BBP00_00008049 [Phytophthora kernoviae]